MFLRPLDRWSFVRIRVDQMLALRLRHCSRDAGAVGSPHRVVWMTNGSISPCRRQSSRDGIDVPQLCRKPFTVHYRQTGRVSNRYRGLWRDYDKKPAE